jgi:hypothetical protein
LIREQIPAHNPNKEKKKQTVIVTILLSLNYSTQIRKIMAQFFATRGAYFFGLICSARRDAPSLLLLLLLLHSKNKYNLDNYEINIIIILFWQRGISQTRL